MKESVAVRLKPLVEVMSQSQSHESYKLVDMKKEVAAMGGKRMDSVRFPEGIRSAYVVPAVAFGGELLDKLCQGRFINVSGVEVRIFQVD